MENKEFPVSNFAPVLVLCYTLLVAGVTFALNIALLVKIAIVVVALLVFSVVLGRSTPGHPPFGTEENEDGIVRPPSAANKY
jgi:hypothetical protein